MPLFDDFTKPPKRGTLARAVEQREVARRAQDAARGELQRYYAEQKLFDTVSGNMLKDDFKRKGREFKEREAEAQLLDTLYQNEKARTLATIKAEEEEKITLALSQQLQQHERQTREVQRLREQSAELRELAEKLRIARINKERAQQLQEKAQLQAQQAEYDSAFLKYVEESAAAEAAREEQHQAGRREANVRARMVLEEQMQEKQDAMKYAEAEAARERAMVDEIVRRIHEEDVAEAALKRAKQDETKAFIAQFLSEQDMLRTQRREASMAEERKIKEYWEMVRDRESREAERQAMRKEVADRMYEKVKKEMEDEMRKREEEEYLINLLRQEELEAKARAEDDARRQKAERLKAEMMLANEQQLQLKEQREAKMKQEEEEFRQATMAKFAEDDRIEQMNAQKRRMKVMEHAREVQRMIDDKRKMFEELKAKEEAELAARCAEEERQAAIVEDERRRLLAEAADLLEYLPRGVVRDKSDLEYINALMAKQSLKT